MIREPLYLLRNTHLARVINSSSAKLHNSHGNNQIAAEPKIAAASLDYNSALPTHKIPGPKSYPFIGTLHHFLIGGKYHNVLFDKLFIKLKNEYGELVQLAGSLGKKDIIFVYNADDIEKVYRTEGIWPYRPGFDSLVYHRKIYKPPSFKTGDGIATAKGENWGKIRSQANPTMMQPRITKVYAGILDEITREFVERIKTIIDKDGNVPFNFGDEVNKWTLETIAYVSFDTRLGILHQNLEDDSPPIKIMRTNNEFINLSYNLDIQPSIWRYVTTPTLRKMLDSLDTMANCTLLYVNQATERLKLSASEKPEREQSVFERLVSVDKELATLMAMDIILAGVETTASSAIIALYHLARNPDKQEKLRQEILRILPNKSDVLTAEKLTEMSYLKAAIKESLRLMPVSVANARVIGQDIVLQGYQVPKGTEVLLPHSMLSISEENFPEPQRYLPERWLRRHKEETGSCPHSEKVPKSKNAHPFSYMPFGFGPRMCVGKRFADLEMETLLINMLRNFKIEYSSDELVLVSKRFRTPRGPYKFKLTNI